jgi:hypothetical protein
MTGDSGQRTAINRFAGAVWIDNEMGILSLADLGIMQNTSPCPKRFSLNRCSSFDI